ncbi:MAG TPA: DUF6144 family protein [Clostridia bacterium]|nr:DUF6144 family protein [Clostridia bacterium]
MDIDKMWIKSVINLMDKELKKEDMNNIIHQCGKHCAYGCGIIDQIKNAGIASDNPDEIFEKLNSPEIFGSRIVKGDNCFYTICEKCYCPFIEGSTGEIPHSYCECSRSWTEEVFGAAFKRPVKAEILQSIVRGADFCKIKIIY